MGCDEGEEVEEVLRVLVEGFEEGRVWEEIENVRRRVKKRQVLIQGDYVSYRLRKKGSN